MNPFISRTDIAGSLEDLLVRVADTYKLGSVRSHKILPDGYQELNILLDTSGGRFVVKIFSKEKTLERVKDNIWGYLTFRKVGVPMPILRQARNGDYLLQIKGESKKIYLCVMEFFNGFILHSKLATQKDIQALSNYMAIIHSHIHRIRRYYDTMGIVNVLSQFKQVHSYLKPNLLSLIHPVIEEFSSLQMGDFHQSIIHGTFEPENILKNSRGELCLLDLGCMDYNASIVDIATFLANYTVDLTELDRKKRIDIILETYNINHPLSSQELTAIPILVRGQYAVIALRTNYYIRKRHDKTKQTKHWYNFARKGLIQWRR